MINRKRKSVLDLTICFFTVFFLTAGCGAVHSNPFAEFTASLQEVESGADAALRYLDSVNRDSFIQETAEASQSTEGFEAVQRMLLSGDDRNDAAGEMDSARLFVISPRFRSGINMLNNTLVSYSQLLETLAGSRNVSQTEFEGMIKELNEEIKSAVATLQSSGSEGIGGMVSTDASQAACAYIDDKRNRNLRKVLEENQPLIVELSGSLQDTIQASVRNIRTSYDDSRIKLGRELRPDLTVGIDARKQTVAELIELNDDFVTRLRILESLNDSYRLLPKAHAELVLAMEKPGHDLTAVNELFENGARMHTLYEKRNVPCGMNLFFSR